MQLFIVGLIVVCCCIGAWAYARLRTSQALRSTAGARGGWHGRDPYALDKDEPKAAE